jgi:hypothetical protein
MTAWQWSAHSILIGLAASLSIAISRTAWTRRNTNDHLWFTGMMLGASVWAAGTTVQLLTADLRPKLVFRTIRP